MQQNSEFPQEYNNLNLIFEKIWSVLETGIKPISNNPAHTPALATIDHNNLPQIRSVVLRSVNRPKREIWFHSDIRSSKISDLSNNKNASFLIYDPKNKFQIRLLTTIKMYHNDPKSSKAWNNLKPMSKICYQVSQAPGTQLSDPLKAINTPEINNEGRDNFVVLVAKIIELEWLYLHHKGHRRARFNWLNNNWDSGWITP
tara:strand:+ start:186 stop:788 length:603 start_codon:yes stop_codon:yes gene_type:complete